MPQKETSTKTATGYGVADQRAVAVWLFLCCGSVVVMIVIGGITRLTESGLSMIEWRPLVGMVPPLSVGEWERIFGLYRETPEFRIENPHIELDGFKSIFWWEYVHRLWGQLIGILFVAGFLWLLLCRRIEKPILPHLVTLFILGGAQGVIGWWMVRSGFADRTDVSQYRLVIHLGMAFIILGYMLWLALSLMERESVERVPTTARRLAFAVLGVVSVTLLSGGLTAGLDAGLVYNTWPLIDGGVAPHGLFIKTPIWLNFFENVATVQFDHRFMAYLTFGFIIALWLRVRRTPHAPNAVRAVHTLLAIVAAQAALGVLTLVLVVPLPLAVAHQMGAVALFSTTVWTAHALR
jgi:cytochrome c oxidase assembly protein subunit 15